MIVRSRSGVALRLVIASLFSASGTSLLAHDRYGSLRPTSFEGLESVATWLIAAAVVLILLALLGAHRRRLQQMERRERELRNLVAQRTRDLEQATLRDGLTGLRNRRFMDEVLIPECTLVAERMQHVANNGGPRATHPVDLYMGLFVIDIDHFEQVNDLHGHVVGDQVLEQFAAVLEQAIRKDDIGVRWGGGQFLVVLRNTVFAHIEEFASELRRRVENARFVISDDPDHTIRRTCSIGYVPFPFHRAEPERLSFDQAVMLAEMGLHEAKQTGQNRTVGVLPTDTPPSVGDLAPLMASLDYGEANGLLEVRNERTAGDEESRAPTPV